MRLPARESGYFNGINMSNRNYEKGRRKEYKLKKHFEKFGWIILRTAGSHGFADLIMINRDSKQVRFVQVKPKNFSQKERVRLEQKYKWLNDRFQCCFSVD